MSSIGRISGGTASLDFTVDLNATTLSSIIAQEQKISDLQSVIYGIDDEIKNEVIGDMGKVITIDEETGESTTTKTSVRQNLETLYEIITGVAAVTGNEELAVPLIGFKALYDEADHLYQEGHSIYEAINNFKNLLGNPYSSGEIQDTDEDGNLKWYDPETQTLPIYKTIQPTGLHQRAYNLEQLLKIINTVEEASTLFELINAVPKEYNYRDHLCINNDNEDGEIRFITKDAYKYNDHNYNWNGYNYFDPVELFVGSDNYFYKDPRRPNPDDPDGAQISNRLNYNVKIGKDGRLYFYHNEYILTSIPWTAIIGGGSGWYELDTAFNSIAFNVFLNQVQIAYLNAKLTTKAVSDGAVAAAQGTTTTVKEALLIFLEQFKTAALTAVVVVSGLVAGQLLIDNAEVKQLQDSILDLDKDLNSLLLEIEKIEKEIQNIDDGKARDPDNKPFDDASLSKTDLEELKTKYLEIIDAIKQERLRQQKILLKRIGFIHIDYLQDSKFNLDEVNDADGNFQNYKLVSNDLNHLVDNVGFKGNGVEPSTLLFKDVEDIFTAIGVKNFESSTGIYKSIYDILTLIGNKTLTTPPKDPTGILGNIEEIQNLLGISEETTTETTLISRIETNENDIASIQDDITTINSSISGIETELGTSGDGVSINSKIANLQTFTGITDPLPTKSLKEEIDSIREITGYDDSSLLYLLLPQNSDGTIPTIEENTINNDSLIHLGYKGLALKENFQDYFILYVMPYYSVSTNINSANRFLVKDLVGNKEPSETGLEIQNAIDEYVSALRGWFLYQNIVLSNDWYFSIYVKNVLSNFETIYSYNNIEVLLNTSQIKVQYQKYITTEIHYLDPVWTDGLQINIINYFGRNGVVQFTNSSSYYLNHSLTFISANPNRQLSDYYNMFLDNNIYQSGFEMYPFKNAVGDYIIYHTGSRFAPFEQWKFTIRREWTKSPLVGGETIYIRIFIMATNTEPTSYASFSMIYESAVLSLAQAQYQALSNFTLNTGNTTGYNYWFIAYNYVNSAGNVITDHDTKNLMIGKVRQLLVEYQQTYQNYTVINNHNITFDNNFKHIAFNDRVVSQNKIIYYADGIEKGTVNIPSDRLLINNYNFNVGGLYTYRAFGIGNGILTTQKLNEISQLAKTNYRVRIPELTVMDEVYITETLILENDIQFRNSSDGSTFNYYTETDSSGSRRRQGIQQDGVTIETFTYTDELIFRTTPTQNQFLFYNSTTGLFEGINTTDFYTKADIDSKGYLTQTQLNNAGYLTSIPSEYITETELNSKGYLTQTQLNNAGYLTSIPSEYITETELNSKGYLTTIPSEYITQTELNNAGYLTQTELNNAGYLTTIPTEYITETELNSKGYITASEIPDNIVDITELDSRNYITQTQLNDAGYITASEIPANIVDITELDSRNYVSYDDFSKNQASEIDPGIVKYNDITGRFYTVDKIQKEDVDGLIETIQNIPNVYTFSEQFPVLNHLILDRYFEKRATEYLELYVKFDDFTYTLAPHLYIEYTYLGVQQFQSTYQTNPINIHKNDIIRFKAELISSDNEPLYTHHYYFKDELGNIMTNDGGVPRKWLDTTTNWIQETEYPLNYKLRLYRSNRIDDSNEILIATFNVIQEAYEIEFKPDVMPKVVEDIIKINNDLQINYSDSTNTTINILDNSLVKNIVISGGFLNYTKLDDTVVSRTLPFIENNVDAVLTFFAGATFTRNSANKIDLLEIDTFNENIIINGSASYGAGSIQLNCENNTHNVKIIAPSHSSFTGGNYTLTLPSDLGISGQVLAINPNSATRNGRLYWTNPVNVSLSAFNQSQFELSGSLISIKSSVLGGGSGSISIADFDNTQFETNTAGKISIIPSVLATGSIINYNDLNVPAGQEEVIQTVDVTPSVAEYITQSPITQYTVLDADAEHLRVHWKFDNPAGTYNNITALFENSAPNPISITLTALSPSTNDGVYSSTDKVIGNGAFYKSDAYSLRGYKITTGDSVSGNWLYEYFNTSKQATFAFWVKNTDTSSTNATQHIFRQDQSFIIREYNGALDVYVSNDNWGSLDSVASTRFTANVWLHITVVIDLRTGTNNNDVVKIYRNGIELTTTSIGTYAVGSGFFNDSSDCIFAGGGGSSNGFKGYLDDFRIYDKVLTPTEIGYLANNMVKIQPQPLYETQSSITQYTVLDADATNLITHYKFDDAQNLGKDELNQRNLINTNAESLAGVIGDSSYFADGDNLHISNFNLNFDNTITTTGLSISLWFKLDSTSEYYGHLFMWGTHNTNGKFGLMRYNLDLKLVFQVGTTMQTSFNISAYNTWINLIITIDTSRLLKVYENATLIHQFTLTASQYSGLTTSSPFTLGKAYNVDQHDYKGYLDDFRIYNKVLTPTEIGYLANNMIVNPDYKTLTFTYNSANVVSGQTPYTLTFDNPTECDILVVAGGGGGGKFGGGGGGGSILFRNNIELNGTLNIKIGKGGIGASDFNGNGTNGLDSSITIDGVEYIAKGGGGGGTRNQTVNSPYPGRSGNSGGSGGGGSHADSGQTYGGTSNKNTYTNWQSYGNPGGNGIEGFPSWTSGGGGGAGSVGVNATSTKAGNGGSGKEFITYFGTNVGHNGWFGGGGGGNIYENTATTSIGYGNGGNGLYGGGGNGGYDGSPDISAVDGLPNTGGGGGGGTYSGGTIEDQNGGHGGSGIVIIRYKTTSLQTITEGTGTSQSGYMKYDGTTWDLVNIEIPDSSTIPTKLTDLSTEGFTLTTAEISDFPTISTTISELTNGEIFKNSLTGTYVILESLFVEDNFTVENNITALGNTNINNIQVNNSFNSSCLIQAHNGITIKGGGIYLDNVSGNTFYSERLIQGNGGLVINGNTTLNDRAIIYDGLYVGSLGYESWMYIPPQGTVGLFGIDYVSSAIRPFWGGSYQAIMANGNIATNGWLLAYSDERIKTEIEDLDDTECLNILNQIKPVKYHYKDPARRGEHKTIGYIAQQIKEVLPNAVKLQKGYLPNILEIAKYDLETNIIELDEASSFTPTSNLNIKIMDNKEHNDITITDVIDDKHFKIDTTLNTSNIYVYGSLTDDIHTISKEAINAVHLSASQELHRMILAQQQIIDDLKTRIEALENI